MEFRMLGPLAAHHGGEAVALGGPKQRTVLALLLVDANKVVTTDRLIDELYGEEPPEAARKSLQSYIANLRKAVNRDGELLQGRTPGYVLEVDSSQVDVLVFERLVHQARAMLDRDPADALQRLTEALALWYGAPLIDVADEAPSLRQEVVRLAELRVTAVEDRIEAELALGRHREAAAQLESLVAEHPLRERFWGQLLLALYRSGRQAEALRAFQKARRVLGEELGIEPSPALRELEERILTQDATLDLAAPGPSAAPGPGRVVRGYELRERVGAGRLGTVYRAYQPAMGREVALEVARPDLAAGVEFARRFEADGGQFARLEHPHVVPVYDYWREPDGAFLVTRWMRGGTLAEELQRGTWRLDAVSRLVEQLGSAAVAAHRHGMVHGEIGPRSVLLDESGNCYLGGFPIGFDGGTDPDLDTRSLALTALEALTGEPVITETPPPVVPPAVFDVVRTATAPPPEGGFEHPGAFVAAFLAATAHRYVPPALRAAANPYKGLRAFAEADAADFFGREAFTDRLADRLGEQRFLAVVGPSGSGKSSVVRAGLVPAVRRGALPGSASWFVVEMQPGATPWEELEAALLRIAVNPPVSLLDQLTGDVLGLHRTAKRVLPGSDDELLLIIDQFEELFTMVDDADTRSRFMDAVVAAVTTPGSQLRVVMTLRADFYDRPLRHAAMGALVTDRMETVRPLTADELGRAIAGPAHRVGLGLEPELATRIAADVADQPGALPLLQYTLTELVDRRSGPTLTLDDYRALGGVSGALGRRAEELYDGLDPSARAATRQLFLRLVAIGEGTTDTRRRVVRSELTALEGQRRGVEAVLDTFGAHRLLSFDRDPITRSPTVELAHEALLDEWQRLRRWIDDGRADLRDEKALGSATADWHASGRDPSYLLSGARLRRFASWHEASRFALTRPEADFLAASIEAQAVAETREQERIRREAVMERRSRTRLRLLVAVLGVAAAVAVALTLVARSETRESEHNLAIAVARALTADSIQQLDVDPELSLLLAIEAADTARAAGEELLPETVEALHRAVLAGRVILTVPGGRGGFSPNGSRFITADPGTIFAGGTFEGGARVYSIDGEELLVLRGHDGRTIDARYSPDGATIVTTSLDGTARLWDAATGTELRVLESSAGLFAAAFSPDGQLLAVGGLDGVVRTFEPATAQLDAEIRVDGFVEDVALSESGLLAVAADTDGAFLVDVETGEQLHHLTGHRLGTCRVELTRDGSVLATSSQDGTARLWDTVTGAEIRRFTGHAGPVCGLALSPSGDRLATAGEDGTARVWDLETGGELVTVSGHATGIGGVSFDPGGRLIATAGGDGVTKLWDVSPEGSREVLAVGTGVAATFTAYSDDGAWLAAGTDAGSVSVWDSVTGERLVVLEGHGERVSGGGFIPNGSLLATSGEDRTARVWDVTAGSELFVVSAHTDTVWGSTFSPDGAMLATGGLDGLVALWRVPDGAEIARLGGADPAFSVSFGSDGLLAAAGVGIRIWDISTGSSLVAIEGHRGAILAVEFSPDGDVLASAGADGSVKLWDATEARSGELREVSSLRGHTAAVLDVVFSRDGSLIATASLDNTVKLWTGAGEDLFTLPVRMPGFIAFNPAGTRLAVPSADGTVRSYVLPLDELLDLARSRLTRPFTAAECERYLRAETCPSG